MVEPEIDVQEQVQDEGNPEDKWYFVDDSIKDRLNSGDGPSFSVASLFSSSSAAFVEQEEPPTSDVKPTAAPDLIGHASIWKKDSLFVLDQEDSRISKIGQFFNFQPSEVNANDMTRKRREISLIVHGKFKRIERNQEKFHTGQSRNFNPRRHFKKQKT